MSWGLGHSHSPGGRGLVVQGLTNREAAERLFVSPHTVSTRLRHVFDKLKLNSLMELAVVAAWHGVPTVCLA